MNTKELDKFLSETLAAVGFRQRKHAWYKANEDTITLVDLQKSEWGGQYYINLGVYLRDLGKASSPSEHQCHIRVRLSSIVGDDRQAIEEALDLERTGISSEHRTRVLGRALKDTAVPFLADRSALPRLRELFTQGALGPVFTTKVARELLENVPA